MSFKPPSWLSRLKIDWYLVLIIGMVALASVLPPRGQAAPILDWITKIAIGAVFFLHGARLSREAVIKGMGHWRLHLLVLAATFGLFPLLSVGMAALPAWITPPSLAAGIIFLGCLPSTIQSSIAFTAVARGNVAAAIASASASNLIGVFLTPVLVGVLLHAKGQASFLDSVQAIVLQLLVPFVAGQVLRRWIGEWVAKRSKWLGKIDRGSILLVVYTAFGAAVREGVWHKLGAGDLVRLLILCSALLGVVLLVTWLVGRLVGFDRADRIAVLFCGSKKSLASGVPMASVLFPPSTAGLAILPLMLFHQIQLMACSAIASRYAKEDDKAEEAR